MALARGEVDLLVEARPRVDVARVVREGAPALAGAKAGPATDVRVVALDAGARLAVCDGADGPRLWSPRRPDAGALVPRAQGLWLLGRTRGGVVHVGLWLRQVEPPLPGARWEGLRFAGAALPGDEAQMAASAVALAQWHREARFCARCGARIRETAAGWTTTCPACGHIEYPRTDPAVIVALTDPRGRVLLARNRAWHPGRWSVIAGFVEAGEPPEHAVRREVAEEVGVGVGRLRFQGAQPWPFPRSLMLGYLGEARPLGGQERIRVRPDGEEIAEARFFAREDVARGAAEGTLRLPGPTAIAYALLTAWYGQPLPQAARIGA